MKKLGLFLILFCVLTGCGAVKTEVSDSINKDINNNKFIMKYISGKVEYTHNTALENDGYSYEKFHVYATANKEFDNLSDSEKYNILEKITALIQDRTKDDYTFECGEKKVCAYSSIQLTNNDDTYSFDSLDVNEALELEYNGNVVYSKESDSETTTSSFEEDSSTVDSKTDSSPYTKEELQSDPTAPSENLEDYNSDGEYVPLDGPTDNAADYNGDGEYKPVEDMTQDEIQKELESMIGN
ncbi:hypothetical protein WKH57_14310 [Niallia taxi]|uniref:hypothetical protein n=1 Tax=Niallia taxi TaxID=2499688 RepID=UPI003177DC41